MTISITVPGVTFTKFVGKVLMPFIDEASAFYLFGGDAASSTKNMALGATINGSVIAAPTYGAGFANASHVNGFNTGFVMPSPYTQIIVSQWVSGDVALLGRGNGNADNFWQMLTAELTGTSLAEWPNGKGQNISGLSLGSSFMMQGARWGGGGTKDNVFVRTGTGLLSVSNSVNQTNSQGTPTNTLKVGTGYGPGTFKVAVVMLIPRVLTDAELVQVYDYLKPLLASRSVTMA